MQRVDGYLELNTSDGLFHISDADGFQLFMPKQYRDYQPFDSAKGTVFLDWTANSDQLLIRSNPIATKTPGGQGKNYVLCKAAFALQWAGARV